MKKRGLSLILALMLAVIPATGAAADFSIEAIVEEDAGTGTPYEAEEYLPLSEKVTGTLGHNGFAVDAALRQSGIYSANISFTSYGDQLTGLDRLVYQRMKAEYADKRMSDDLVISLSPALTFQTTGTVSGGRLIWDREHNAEYQEICLTIEYALQSAFDALVYDYPEVFWMGVPDYSYSINYSYSGGTYTGKISSVTFMPTAQVAYDGAGSEIKAFDTAVNQAKNSITAGANRAATVKSIHDYLCDRIVYRETAYAHSAGGVFLHASGRYNYVVCEGYAKAFKILCDKFNIPCILVVGDAGGAHMWNYVKMENGNWYLVDVTWDDSGSPTGDPSYDYFLVGSNTLSAVNSSLDIGRERILYTNFSRADYTCNFAYPTLSYTSYPLDAHSHTWRLIRQIAPTCTEEGAYVYQCSCGKQSYEIVDALGHSYRQKKYVYNNDATCLQDGTKTAVCDNGCGTKRQTVSAKGTKLTPVLTFTASTVKLKTKQSTGKFKASFGSGDYVVSWKSGNTKIVKVSGKSDGSCTLKAQSKTGSTKITVTLASGLKKSFTVKVQRAEVKTTKLSGIPKKLTLARGSSFSLRASVAPFTSKQKVTWKTSDKKVAAVSQKGVVKGKKKGKAVITVQSGSKKVKCKVTVK